MVGKAEAARGKIKAMACSDTVGGSWGGGIQTLEQTSASYRVGEPSYLPRAVWIVTSLVGHMKSSTCCRLIEFWVSPVVALAGSYTARWPPFLVEGREGRPWLNCVVHMCGAQGEPLLTGLATEGQGIRGGTGAPTTLLLVHAQW